MFTANNYSSNPKYKFGVGEHTDYDLLTLLCIDENGGGLHLNVR